MANPDIWKHGFGSRPKEVDDEYRARARGVPKANRWTKEKCVGELNDILELLKKVLKDDEKIDIDNPKKLKQETIRDAITLMNKILDYMKYLYPPVQQNINVNIETTSDAVIERLKNWKVSQIKVLDE